MSSHILVVEPGSLVRLEASEAALRGHSALPTSQALLSGVFLHLSARHRVVASCYNASHARLGGHHNL